MFGFQKIKSINTSFNKILYVSLRQFYYQIIGALDCIKSLRLQIKSTKIYDDFIDITNERMPLRVVNDIVYTTIDVFTYSHLL
jgi:hypothetical protein